MLGHGLVELGCLERVGLRLDPVHDEVVVPAGFEFGGVLFAKVPGTVPDLFIWHAGVWDSVCLGCLFAHEDGDLAFCFLMYLGGVTVCCWLGTSDLVLRWHWRFWDTTSMTVWVCVCPDGLQDDTEYLYRVSGRGVAYMCTLLFKVIVHVSKCIQRHNRPKTIRSSVFSTIRILE